VFLLAVLGCASRQPPPPPGTGAAAAADLVGFVDYLRAVHPEPHRFTTAEDLSALVAAQAGALAAQTAPTELEVGRAFHTVLAAVGDAHIKVGLSLYQGDAPLSLLPLFPRRIEGTYVADAATGLPDGATLLAIDHQPMAALEAELLRLVISEGLGSVPRARALEADFPRYFHLARGMADTYTVTARLSDGSEQDIVLDGLSRAEFSALRPERRSLRWGTAAPAPTLTDLGGGTALLRLPSFGSADMDGYQAQIDALFAALSPSVDTLVVDVRGNIGGLRPNAFAVLDHVLGTPYPQWDGVDAKVNTFPSVSPARLSFPFVPEDNLTQRFPGRPPHTFAGDPLADAMAPTGTFGGAVVVFADGLTNSAANTFVLALKQHRENVTVVGEELGGECAQHIGEFPLAYHTAGYPLVILHSVLRVRHVGVEGCVFGRGLAPDVPVVETLSDFYGSVDPYLRTLAER